MCAGTSADQVAVRVAMQLAVDDAVALDDRCGCVGRGLRRCLSATFLHVPLQRDSETSVHQYTHPARGVETEF